VVKVIIGGCGRVGSQLASSLVSAGHDVCVIDKNRAAFRRLGEDFGGLTVRGFVFDRETLEEAGVRKAQAFVAVTNGDNSNIVSARTAKERFGVARVVARIYDPQRAEIYDRLGITTIASARWTADAVLRELLPEDERVEAGLGAGPGSVALVRLTIPAGVHALHAEELTEPGEWVLAAITRGGVTRVPVAGAVLEGGDQVHLAVDRSSLELVRARLARLAEEDR
jgi:trk system potassium uptake protein